MQYRLSFPVAIHCLSTVLIFSNVEKTTEVAGVWKVEHMENKTGGLELNLHRYRGNGSLKGNNLGGRQLAFLPKEVVDERMGLDKGTGGADTSVLSEDAKRAVK